MLIVTSRADYTALFWRAYRVVARLMLATGIAAVLAYAIGIRFVWTDSLPRGLYWVLPSIVVRAFPNIGTIERGRVVTACLPPAASVFGLARGYIPRGSQCGGAGKLAKVVAAIGGDVVTVNPAGVYINGVRWPWSAPMAKDFNGLRIPVTFGTYRVPAHAMLLLGLNYGSWDGRYFGPIDRDLFRGVAWPVLIENGDAAKELRSGVRIAEPIH